MGISNEKIDRLDYLAKIYRVEQSLDPSGAEATLQQAAKEAGLKPEQMKEVFGLGDTMKPWLKVIQKGKDQPW